MKNIIEYEDGKRVELDENDATELGEAFFAKVKHHSELSADVRAAVENTRMGRPPAINPKKAISIRLDADVLDWLKAQGDGYQSRINDILRDAMCGK